MSDPGQTRFRDALTIYEGAVLPELGAVRTMDAVRLIEMVESFLDGGGALYATDEELEAAVRVALAQKDDPESFGSLTAELARFRDLAIEHGLVARRSREPMVVEEFAVEMAAQPEGGDVARLVTRLVANLIQEGLHSALLINPVAVLVSDLGEPKGTLNQTAELVSNRWQNLADRLQQPLDIFRIAFPVTALLFALNSIFSCSGPLGSRTTSAMVTGAAVNQVKAVVRDMDGHLGDPLTVDSLEELSKRTGKPTDLAANVFRLRRVRWGTIYLEHIRSGKVVVISGDDVGSFDARGTWRMDN